MALNKTTLASTIQTNAYTNFLTTNLTPTTESVYKTSTGLYLTSTGTQVGTDATVNKGSFLIAIMDANLYTKMPQSFNDAYIGLANAISKTISTVDADAVDTYVKQGTVSIPALTIPTIRVNSHVDHATQVGETVNTSVTGTATSGTLS